MPPRVATLVALVSLSLLFAKPSPTDAQVSDPVHHDRAVTGVGGNKFLTRTTLPDTHTHTHDDDDDESASPKDECPANLRLRWMAEVSSSVYATPVIVDLSDDGRKQIVVPSFVHLLEVLSGETGAPVNEHAWPAFHKSHVHASPVVVDTTAGGVEILLPTYDGEVLFFNRDGSERRKKLTLPPLPVKRNWYVRLAPDHVDHSAPDVGGDTIERFESGFRAPDSVNHEDARRNDDEQTTNANARRRLLQEETETERAPGVEAGDKTLTDSAAASFSVFDDHDGDGYGDLFGEIVHGEAHDGDDREGSDGDANDESDDDVGVSDYQPAWQETDGGIPRGDARQGVGRTAPTDLHDHFSGVPGVAPPTTHHAPKARGGWEDESFQRRTARLRDGETDNEKVRNTPFVNVDAHLLCTPSVADVDGDGFDEIVLAVSFFFDKEYYQDTNHLSEMRDLGVTVDLLGKYVANAVVVVDYETLATKWTTQLDLSTDAVTYKAFAYSAPTVVDLDGDGVLEIVLGTSVGFLYVLSGADGSVKKGWPKQMAEIQGQVSVADLTGDGSPEIVAVDLRGSVAVFKPSGEEVWETHLASSVSTGVTLGDVDGDGRLEVVVGTSGGAIHVLRGADGTQRKPFPFRTKGRIMAQVVLSDLASKGDEGGASRDETGDKQNDGIASASKNNGLTLIVPSFDGFVYVIDGKKGCYDVLDVGETAYASVLVDDVTGNGMMDVVVSTMNGNVYLFESSAAIYDPTHAWNSQVHAGNNLAARGGPNAYAVKAINRKYRDIKGTFLDVSFEIRDGRWLSSSLSSSGKKNHRPYFVTVTLTAPGFVSVKNNTYASPGSYSLRLDTPRTRVRGRVAIHVADAHSIFAQDAYSVSFHARGHRALKWILALPFAAATASILTLAQNGEMVANVFGQQELLGHGAPRRRDE